MPKTTYKVFVSSTFIDNENRRKIVEDAIIRAEMLPVGMERFNADTKPTVDYCTEKSAECDVLIGIIAKRYGWIPENSEISITELEYDANPSRLMFLIDPKISFTQSDFDQGDNWWLKTGKLEKFKKKINKDQLAAVFNADNLGTVVLDSLNKWREKKETEVEKQEIIEIPLVIPPRYKSWVKDNLSTFDIEKMGDRAGTKNLNLNSEAYIILETQNPFKKKEKDPKDISIEELLTKQSCIVLKGQAGMGKSTLCKHFAFTITQGSCKNIFNKYLPLFISLKDFSDIYNEQIEKKETTFFEEIFKKCINNKKILGLNWEIIDAFKKEGRVLFLFDGLDEISEDTRSKIINIIHTFYGDNKKNSFLITGRPNAFDENLVEKFRGKIFEINELTDDKINNFIKYWFKEMINSEAESNRESSKMITDIYGYDEVMLLIRNPLLLTIVCILYKDGGYLPESRADLYNRIITRLLNKFKLIKSNSKNCDVPDQKAEEFLMTLAFNMREKNLVEIPQYEAEKILKKVFPKGQDLITDIEYENSIEAKLTFIEAVCGMIKRRETKNIEFSHLSFQEFLAAKYIIRKGLDYNLEFKTKIIKNDNWRKTIVLLLGHMNIEREKPCKDFLKFIIKRGDNDQNNQTYLWLLSAEILCELIGRDGKKKGNFSEIIPGLRTKLESIINNSENISERFDGGLYLGEIGDLRIGSDKMRVIPSGEFIRGANDFDDEKTVKKIFLDEYEIGQYPVTNYEYENFVNADGYKNSDYWSKEGFQFIRKEQVKAPEYFQNRKWNRPNFPVVGVSWYEVEAYINWLNLITGFKYSLPTETQWEKAARGTDGRVYPWGNKFDKLKCNLSETGINRTSPVGVFPSGESPYNCMDMSGNVWEWCFDWYDKSFYKSCLEKNPCNMKNGEHRVLRGGGWGSSGGSVRSAARSRFTPDDRSSGIGFRLSRGPS